MRNDKPPEGSWRIEKVIGENLRTRRLALQPLTQEQVADKVGKLLDASWSRQTVYVAEKGGRSFTASELLALALVLGTNVEALFRPPLEADEIALPSGRALTRDELTYSRVEEESLDARLYEMRKTLRELQRRAQQHRDAEEAVARRLQELFGEPDVRDQDSLIRMLNDDIETLTKSLSSRPEGGAAS